jgi:6-phosphogluconolactonase (cycloisomerase 2 family)
VNCTICGDSPSDFGIDYATNTIYGSNTGDGTVVGFSVDNSTGTLTNLPGSPYIDAVPKPADPGGGPVSIAVPIDGQYVYASNLFTNDIAIYHINNDASLTLLEHTPNTYGGVCASGILRSGPAGRYLYSLGAGRTQCNGGTAVLGFAIDPGSGELSAVPNAPFLNPNVLPLGDGVAVTP